MAQPAFRRWVFGLMFLGASITFLPMHVTGLIGMPRRVYTYPVGMGCSISSLPSVTSREPLWDQPNLLKDVEDGRYYLPGTATGGREALVTSPFDARPQYILQIPGPGWQPVLAAVFTAAFFLLLTVKFVFTSVICGVLAIGCVIWWLWETDPGPVRPPADIGGGIVVPVYVTGPMNHSWWAMIVLMVVSGMVFTCLIFSYLCLWLVNPGAWPPHGTELPERIWPFTAAALFVVRAALIITTSASA
jgi:cytochrome c oxidase subunit I+III